MTRDLKPFERRYTPEQRRAVVHALLDARPKLTASQAVRRAAAGTLPGSELPPFGKEQLADGQWLPIPEQTAYAWKRHELQERGVKANGRLAKADTATEAFKIVLGNAWSDLEKATTTARNMKMRPAERMKTVREAVLTGRAIHEAERTIGEKAGSTKQPPSTEPEKTERKPRNTEADNLARAARKRAETEPDETTTQQGTAPAPGNRTDAAQDTDSGARGHSTTGIELAGHSANQLAPGLASGPENGSTARV